MIKTHGCEPCVATLNLVSKSHVWLGVQLSGSALACYMPAPKFIFSITKINLKK